MDRRNPALQLPARCKPSNIPMNLDMEKAARPLRKLRSALKKLDREPTPEDVHKLRTNARKTEAVLHALTDRGGKGGHRILKELKPMRKAAGQVRDMDVLIAKAAPLCIGPDCEDMVRLLEHLAERRSAGARHLHRQAVKHGPELRRLLKRTKQSLEKRAAPDVHQLFEPPAGPQILAAELEHWPKLHRDNLHDFRIRVKELRYMLQLYKEQDEELLDAYAQVKDTAGEWHDWLELLHIATHILRDQSCVPVLQTIKQNMRETLRSALTTANAVRKQGFIFPQAA